MSTGKQRPTWRRMRGVGMKKVFPDRSAIYVERGPMNLGWRAHKYNIHGDEQETWNAAPYGDTAQACMDAADKRWPS